MRKAYSILRAGFGSILPLALLSATVGLAAASQFGLPQIPKIQIPGVGNGGAKNATPQAVKTTCDCAEIETRLARVTTAEEVWKEIFAWARGSHPDIPEPKSNDQLNAVYQRLASAPRAEWDRLLHEPMDAKAQPKKVAGLNADGEPVVDADFKKANCPIIVDAVGVHERAHKDFYASPGNSLAGAFSSKHFKIRSESEVAAYRAEREFLAARLKERSCAAGAIAGAAGGVGGGVRGVGVAGEDGRDSSGRDYSPATIATHPHAPEGTPIQRLRQILGLK